MDCCSLVFFFFVGLWGGAPPNAPQRKRERRQEESSEAKPTAPQEKKGSAAAAGKNEMEFNLLNEMEFFRNSSQQAAHQAAPLRGKPTQNQSIISSFELIDGCCGGERLFFYLFIDFELWGRQSNLLQRLGGRAPQRKSRPAHGAALLFFAAGAQPNPQRKSEPPKRE